MNRPHVPFLRVTIDGVVYFYAEDFPFAASVIIHRGSSSDVDQAKYVETFLAFDARTRSHNAPVFVLVNDPDGEPPNAKWRKSIAEASRNINPRAMVAFVSESTVTRGIVMAINWLRPPPYRCLVASSLRETITWVERERPGARSIIQRLYTDARSAADRDSPRSMKSGSRTP